MSEKKVAFLETTIQISRRIYDPRIQEVVEDEIKNFDLTTSSTYVKMEFTRSFVEKGLVYLYNIARRLEDFPLIFTHLTKLPPVQRRRLNDALLALGIFFKERDLSSSDVLEELLLYLPHAIEEAWEGFDGSVDGLIDETGCVKAKEPLVKVGDAYSPFKKCKKAEKKCRIDEFFKNNKPQFELVLNKILSIPDEDKDAELRRTEKILKKALDFPENMLDADNCWNCGDAIISVECPKEAILLTTNIKHYGPLLDSLAKKSIGIKPIRTKPKKLTLS